MQCRNCGATIREGDTFCRTCGFTVDTSSKLETDSNNVAMNDFIAPSAKEASSSHPLYYDETITKVVEPKVSAPDNKKLIEKDGNDRAKATLYNFLGLAAILAVVGIIAIILYRTVFQYMF